MQVCLYSSGDLVLLLGRQGQTTTNLCRVTMVMLWEDWVFVIRVRGPWSRGLRV